MRKRDLPKFPLEVKIDTREPEENLELIRKYMYDILLKILGLEDIEYNELIFKKEQLRVGDYVCGNVGIERKEDDFIVSNVKTIKGQVSELVMTFPHPYLIIVNDSSLVLEDFGGSEDACLAFLASLGTMGCVPYFVPDNDTFCKLVAYLFLKGNDKKQRLEPRTILNRASSRDYFKDLLMRFPGIGEVTADKIVKHYPNFHEFYNDVITTDNYLNLSDKERKRLGLPKLNVERLRKVVLGVDD
ncbi:MAG: hypothetical protein DRJ64_06530 [Thermoprotei archaeon]|nr:MAG: hypothetical protein DRJ64_06530 [Thermoprotei archaeon]